MCMVMEGSYNTINATIAVFLRVEVRTGSCASSMVNTGVCSPCTLPAVSLRMPRKVKTAGTSSADNAKCKLQRRAHSLRP